MRAYLILVLVLLSACSSETGEQAFDILIINGLVYDGSLAPGKAINIGIRDDRIASIDAAADAPAGRVIDAAGKLVVPGFIDPHTHAKRWLLDPATSANLNYLMQGVTTVFIGNDGDGLRDRDESLATFEAQGIGPNVAFFAGHGLIRRSVMDMADRLATDAELEAMRGLLREEMQAGAFGLSTGLFYAPGSYSDTAEIIELARVAAGFGGVYDTHMRSESSHADGLLAALDEALRIAAESGIAVHISHIKALGKDVWSQTDAMIAAVDEARANGLDITANQYPWLASGTRFSNALIPRWVMADSTERMFERLAGPETGAEIRVAMAENLERRGGPDAMLVTEAESPFVGMTLRDIAGQLELPPVEAAIIAVESGDPSIASFVMHREGVDRLAVQPWVMTGSDGSSGHPRLYGTYPKAWRDFVIDRRLMSVERFVNRSSGQVADTFGICGRGYLRDNYFADIAIIDPDTFAALATYENPVLLSTGVEQLIINGVVTVDGGYLDALPGRVLRKKPSACE